MRASRGRGSLRFNEARQRYEAVIVIDGRKHTRTATTKREAEKALDALREKAAGGTAPTRELADSFLTRWLEFISPPSVEVSTWKGYESKVRLYLLPSIGRVPLERLGPQHFDSLFREMSKRGLSASTVGQTRRIAHTAMQQALYWRLISSNPVALTRSPRNERRERSTLSPSEAMQFIDSVQGDRWEALWTVAACLGLRQGEILGLQWDDVGPAHLNVRQAMKPGFVLGTTKTRQERKVPLPDFVVKSLLQHREIQTFASRNPVWDNRLNLVFTRADGHPLLGTVVTQRLYKLLDRAGLQRISFHDLRHCAASLLIARGVNARQVMSILGHAHLDMTLSRYAHSDEDSLRGAAEALEVWRAQ